jgi:hypothetical protein
MIEIKTVLTSAQPWDLFCGTSPSDGHNAGGDPILAGFGKAPGSLHNSADQL